MHQVPLAAYQHNDRSIPNRSVTLFMVYVLTHWGTGFTHFLLRLRRSSDPLPPVPQSGIIDDDENYGPTVLLAQAAMAQSRQGGICRSTGNQRPGTALFFIRMECIGASTMVVNE